MDTLKLSFLIYGSTKSNITLVAGYIYRTKIQCEVSSDGGREGQQGSEEGQEGVGG